MDGVGAFPPEIEAIDDPRGHGARKAAQGLAADQEGGGTAIIRKGAAVLNECHQFAFPVIKAAKRIAPQTPIQRRAGFRPEGDIVGSERAHPLFAIEAAYSSIRDAQRIVLKTDCRNACVTADQNVGRLVDPSRAEADREASNAIKTPPRPPQAKP